MFFVVTPPRSTQEPLLPCGRSIREPTTLPDLEICSGMIREVRAEPRPVNASSPERRASSLTIHHVSEQIPACGPCQNNPGAPEPRADVAAGGRTAAAVRPPRRIRRHNPRTAWMPMRIRSQRGFLGTRW